MVTDQSTGAPLAGATVTYGDFSTYPVEGSVTTAQDGSYVITRVYGRTAGLPVSVTKAGYAASATQTATVPPDAANVNFQLAPLNVPPVISSSPWASPNPVGLR